MIDIAGSYPLAAVAAIRSKENYRRADSPEPSLADRAEQVLESALSRVAQLGPDVEEATRLWMGMPGHRDLALRALGQCHDLKAAPFDTELTIALYQGLDRDGHFGVSPFIRPAGTQRYAMHSAPQLRACVLAGAPDDVCASGSQSVKRYVSFLARARGLGSSGNLLVVGSFDACRGEVMWAQVVFNDLHQPVIPGADAATPGMRQAWIRSNLSLEEGVGDGVSDCLEMTAEAHALCHTDPLGNAKRFVVSNTIPAEVPVLNGVVIDPLTRHRFSGAQVFDTFAAACAHVAGGAHLSTLDPPGAWVYVLEGDIQEIDLALKEGATIRDCAGGVRLVVHRAADGSNKAAVHGQVALQSRGHLWKVVRHLQMNQ